MDYKYVINIKGISASGKSSRLHVFVEYMRSKGLTLEDFVRPDFNGKEQSYGTLIKELNLVILGKNYVKDGVARFQGFDAVTGRQDKAAKWSDFMIAQMAEGYSFIVEGAGITCSHRYRPEFLADNLPGLSFVANYYYNFEPNEKPDYLARVKYRSGKEPKKDSMWNNNEGIRSDFNKADKEFESIRTKYPDLRYDSFYGSFREPISHFGEVFFAKVFNSPEHIEPFKKFCEEYDYINKNKYSGPVIEESAPTISETGKTEDKAIVHNIEEHKKEDVNKAPVVPAPGSMGMEIQADIGEGESLTVVAEISKDGINVMSAKDTCTNCGKSEYVKDTCPYCGHAKGLQQSAVTDFSGISEINDPKTELSIFPKTTIDREIMKWEDHLFDFTPVEKVGKMYFKREDRFAPLGYGGLNGSKLRQCIWLLTQFKKQKDSMLISGASVKSPQLPMGTAVARHFGLPSVHILGATNPKSSIKRDMVEMATWMGAKFQYESVGYNPFLQSKTKELYDSRGNIDFYLNYGITPPADASNDFVHAFHAIGAFQTQNIPENMENIIIPTGSTNSAISILYGLTKFIDKFPNLKNVYLIGIGPDKTKMINHRLDLIRKISGVNTKNFHLDRTLAEAGVISSDPNANAFHLNYRNIFEEGYTDYQAEIKFNYQGIEFHPTYEGKVMKYVSEKMPEILTENTMLWIIGSRPKIEFMDHMKPEFGEIPTEAGVYADNSVARKKATPAETVTPKESAEAADLVIHDMVQKGVESDKKLQEEVVDSLDRWIDNIREVYSKNGGRISGIGIHNGEETISFTLELELPREKRPNKIESAEVKEVISEESKDTEIPLDPTIGLDLTEEDTKLVEQLTDKHYDDPDFLSVKLQEVADKYKKVDQNKLPFKEKCDVVPGRVTAVPMVIGGDFRLPEHRRELFLDFYEFHLKYKAHPGAVYYVFPYIFEKINMNIEQRLWFAFINGCTQNVLTTWMIYKQFPNLSEITFDKFEEWHRANWKKLHYDIDRRYRKGHMVEMWQDYVKNLDGKTQVEYFSALASTGDPEKDFWSVWNAVIKNFKWYGRLSTYSYLEYLKIVGLKISCPSLFLYEKEGSKSPRNGLSKVMGRDDLDWHKDNEEFKGYGEDVLKWLEEESHLLLADAQEKFKDSSFIDDVNFFTLESTLCCFKSWFRKNRRYPNVYNDMFYDRIVKMEAEDWGENDLQMFWDVRALCLPDHLRMERNPDDLGIHPFKQNWFRDTGQVTMMDKDFPMLQNEYEAERKKHPLMKRRNIRPDEVSCSIDN